eukprot:6491506-Amphidinium_carterae.6
MSKLSSEIPLHLVGVGGGAVLQGMLLGKHASSSGTARRFVCGVFTLPGCVEVLLAMSGRVCARFGCYLPSVVA